MKISSLPNNLAQAIDRFVAWMGKLPLVGLLTKRLTIEEKAYVEQSSGLTLNLHVAGTLLILSLIVYFVVLRIGHYFNWPPDVYRHKDVFNLTSNQIEWEVFYGENEPCGSPACMLLPSAESHFFQKKMVLPAREFPLREYKKGQLIFYRTSLKIPQNLIQKSQSGDPIVFHSLYIWAKNFDFYVNGVFLASGGQELLNLSIPRALIPPTGEIVVGFRIDPQDLPYQGIAHRGDLVIGPRSILAPTTFIAEERRTVFFLWFLLPKLAFSIMFAMLYLAVAQRSALFFFCLYGFLSALDVFFASGYAADMIPWVSGPHLELVFRVLASLALSRFVMDFFRRTTPNVKRLLNTITLGLVITMSLVWIIGGSNVAMVTFSAIATLIKPIVLIHGAYSALLVSIYLAVEQKSTARIRIAFCIGLVMMVSIPSQLYESYRWVLDLLGKSGNTAGMYLYLVWIFDLVLFVVLSAVMAAEFGMNLIQKKRLSNALDAIKERLGLAQSVQLMLMPRDQMGQVGKINFRVFSSPSEEVSGDWFQVWQREEGLTIFQGDVVGKGPSAALSVSIVVGILTECRRSKQSVEESIRRIGLGLYDLFGGAVNTTLSAIHVAHDGSEVALFACGSVGWFHVNHEEAQYLPLRGAPLGQTQTPAVGTRVMPLKDGCAFFTFSDGCLEGSRAIKKLLQEFKGMAPELRLNGVKLNELVLATGKNFVHEDDKTMVFMVNGLSQDQTEPVGRQDQAHPLENGVKDVS